MDNEQNRYPMRGMFFGIPAGLRGEKQPVFSPLAFVILPAQLLYRPAVRADTWLLWFGPAVLLLAGAGSVAWIVRRRARALPDRPVAADDDEQEW